MNRKSKIKAFFISGGVLKSANLKICSMNFIYKQLLFCFLLIGCLSVYGQQPEENVVWQERDGKYFLADADGNALSSAVYDQFGDWLGDRAWVRNDQKFGIIGKQGQEMLPVVYENFILDFTESGFYGGNGFVGA